MTKVIILGRPNVGKSTLFNRLTGRRQALVHDLPGVTRDRLEGHTNIHGFELALVDTAGIEAGAAETLQGRLRAKTFAGLEEADVALFVIDAREGLTPHDEELAATLRRYSKPVIVVANKCEARAAISGFGESYRLGFGDPVAISAEHNEGIGELIDTITARLRDRPVPATPAAAPAEPEVPATDAPPEEADQGYKGPLRLAVIGRPNVGKSSLINALIADDRLLTGAEPGLTRDSVRIAWKFADREIELTDTAGLRRRGKIEAPLEKLAASATIRAIRSCHIAMLMLDATQPLEAQDANIADLVVEEGRAMVLGLNKWDLVTDRKGVMEDLERRISQRLVDLKGVTIVTFSALTRRGVDKILPAVIRAYDRWNQRLTTGQLNRWLGHALETHPPPLVQGRRLKIRYMTQVASRPPTFALFANKPAESMPDHYLRYLANSMRESFDLAGVVLRFKVRHGDNPYDKDD